MASSGKIGRKKLILLGTCLVAILFTIFWFLPVIFMFINASKENYEIMINPWALPKRFRLALIAKAWVA